MKRLPSDELSPAQERVIAAIIATRGGNIAKIADCLHVTYQAVANALSVMYDTLYDDLGGNRTIQALVVWYYRTDAGRRIGALCLLCLFCTFTFGGGDYERLARRVRRTGRNEIEYLADNDYDC